MPMPRRNHRPTLSVELTPIQLNMLQTIRDQDVRFSSIPGAPGRARYSYPAQPKAQTLHSPTVAILVGHSLVKHSDRQRNGTEWSEKVGITLRADQVLRTSTKSAAALHQRKEARQKTAEARATAAKLPPPPVDLDTLVASVPGAGRAWVLSVPPVQLLNANDRMGHFAKASLVKSLRQAGQQLARTEGIPPLQAAHVAYVAHFNTRASKADQGNLAPTAKALLDGIVDAGVLPDDSSRYVTGPEPLAGERVRLKGGRISLVIIELPEGIPGQ